MILEDMLKYRCDVHGDTKRDVSGITHDSRKVSDGFIFVALKGVEQDGHDYIETAIARGASVIVCEKNSHKFMRLFPSHRSITWVAVDDCRDALAFFSSTFYCNPSERLDVIGVTGTNGKTSISYILKSILEKWGAKVGLIGTIKYMIDKETFEARHTTPEADDLQSLLALMVEKECRYAISEVSSHALAQKRADYTHFKVAIFTNLTGDHLDYHGDMNNYFISKSRLFLELLDKDGTAVINVDDPYGEKLSGLLSASRPDVRQVKISLVGSEADVIAENITYTFKGTTFVLKAKHHRSGFRIASPLIGETGAYNTLCAAAAALALGAPPEALSEGVKNLDVVKGRFERVDCGQPFLAIVDYAHTHDALQRLLQTARRLLCSQSSKVGGCSNPRKIITVFGCGGDRDRLKRPLMGKIAAELSDFVIITSDNPRSEEPISIIRDIEAGIKKDNFIIIQDRQTAIRMATLLASPGDIVLIAGKGHEDYQEIKGKRYSFSDRKALEEAIEELSSISRRAKAGKVLFGFAQC